MTFRTHLGMDDAARIPGNRATSVLGGERVTQDLALPL